MRKSKRFTKRYEKEKEKSVILVENNEMQRQRVEKHGGTIREIQLQRVR